MKHFIIVALLFSCFCMPCLVTESVVETEPVPDTKPLKQPIKSDELPVKKGNMHLVYRDGVPFYWTNTVVGLAIKQYADRLSFPEGTQYVTDATINKCKNC